jgi:ParB/Sulfiredoxin domain
MSKPQSLQSLQIKASESKAEAKPAATELTIEGRPVFLMPDLLALSPDPTGTLAEQAEEVKDLTESIRHRGLDQPVTLALMPGGEWWAVVDGQRRVRAIADLHASGYREDDFGRPITLSWTQYRIPPKVLDGSDAMLLSELMTAAVRLNAQRKHWSGDQKKQVISKLVLREAQLGLYRAGKWIAEELGCGQPYVNEIRFKLVQAKLLVEVEYYSTRDGGVTPNQRFKSAALTDGAKVVGKPYTPPADVVEDEGEKPTPSATQAGTTTPPKPNGPDKAVPRNPMAEGLSRAFVEGGVKRVLPTLEDMGRQLSVNGVTAEQVQEALIPLIHLLLGKGSFQEPAKSGKKRKPKAAANTKAKSK